MYTKPKTTGGKKMLKHDKSAALTEICTVYPADTQIYVYLWIVTKHKLFIDNPKDHLVDVAEMDILVYGQWVLNILGHDILNMLKVTDICKIMELHLVPTIVFTA